MNELRINRNLARWLLLGLGIVALVVMAVALVATPMNKFNTVSYVALGVGVLGLAGFVLLDPQALVTSLTGRTSQYGATTALMSLVFIVFVVAIFILIRAFKITPLDLTAAHKYELSQQTIDLLAGLKEDIHVIGFYADQDTSSRQETEIWLKQYEKYSNGKITYEFVDPDRNPLVAAKYNVTSPGVIVFTKGDQNAVASSADENALTGALVRVMSGKARKLYMVTGHGERSVDGFDQQAYSQAKTLLTGVGFEITSLSLLKEGSVPADASLVVVAGPTAQFAPTEVEMLKKYLDAGGAALFMFDPATGGGQLGNGLPGLAFNSDGSQLATAGADGTIKVWNVHTGEQLLDLRGHTSDVLGVTFSPDDRQIASAGRDGTVRVWDASSGKEVKQLEGQTAGVYKLAYSRDGSLLASVGENQTLNVWNAKTLDPMSYSPVSVASPLYSIAFSPDSSMIAAGGGQSSPSGTVEGTVYIWDAQSGKEVLNKTPHASIVYDMVFSADGATLYSVAMDGTEGTIDVATKTSNTETLYPNIGITGLVIKADGTRIYSLMDGTIHIRAPEATSTDQDVILTGHTGVIWALRLSPDGMTIATSGRDGTARLWSTEPPTSIRTLQAQASGDPLLSYLKDSWGIQVDDDVVIDLYTARTYNELTPIILTFDTSSPIVQSFGSSNKFVVFSLARSVRPVDPAPTAITLTSLFSSSGEQGSSWGETEPNAQGGYQFDAAGDLPGPLSMGVSAQNTTTKSRVVVYGDSDFASDNSNSGLSAFANKELLTNTANWLTEGENLIDIPVKDIGTRTMDKPLSDVGMTVVRISSICLLPLVGLIAGALVWVIRRRRR